MNYSIFLNNFYFNIFWTNGTTINFITRYGRLHTSQFLLFINHNKVC